MKPYTHIARGVQPDRQGIFFQRLANALVPELPDFD
jgi:hypothetical protein